MTLTGIVGCTGDDGSTWHVTQRGPVFFEALHGRHKVWESGGEPLLDEPDGTGLFPSTARCAWPSPFTWSMVSWSAEPQHAHSLPLRFRALGPDKSFVAVAVRQ